MSGVRGLPLSGRRVVITRAEADAQGFAEEIARLGGVPISLPAIEIGPPDDPAALASAARDLSRFDWVVFTSKNGVERFVAAVAASGRDREAWTGVKIAAVGPVTAGALAAAGLTPDLVPSVHVGEALAEELAAAMDGGPLRVLLPRARIARDHILHALGARGHEVHAVIAYETRTPDLARVSDLARDLEGGTIAAIVFFSSSAVERLADALGERAVDRLARARLVSIGPATSRTMEARGLVVAKEATLHTESGVVAALVAACDEFPSLT